MDYATELHHAELDNQLLREENLELKFKLSELESKFEAIQIFIDKYLGDNKSVKAT